MKKRKSTRSVAQMRAKAATRKSKPKASKTTRDKVRLHRKRMRAKGYRLIQMWVPDTRTAEFAREAHLQSLRASNSPTADLDQAWLDSISWWNSEEAATLAQSEPPVPWWREPE
jgi:hypothetical protein